MIEIRKSDSQGFFYALEIDDDGNEKVIAQADTLDQLRKLPIVPNDLDYVMESETRGRRSADQ